MARIRTLKPEIVADVKLSSVSIEAAYTFVLMITQADDAGLLPGAHRQILGLLYPLREQVTVPVLLGWIEELIEVGLVRWRKTRDGVPVVQVINWSKHQRIDNAGRSQLAALLAEDGGEDGEVAESRGESPRTAANRGLDLRPTTKDHGPRDQEVEEAATRLAVRANQGLADHPTKPQPIARIIASNGTSHGAAEAILAAGVRLEFAEATIYTLARTNRARGEVKSLGYFTDAVLRAWEEHQAGVAAHGVARPPESDRPPSRAAPQTRTARAAAGALAGATLAGLPDD